MAAELENNSDGYDGLQKQQVRLRLAKVLQGRTVDRSLFLTSWEIRDIRCLLMEKAISLDTEIVIVEKCKRDYHCIREAVNRFRWSRRPTVIHGQLSQQSVDPMDLCNLDFCGVVDWDTAIWMETLPMNQNATISITMSYTERDSSDFLCEVKALLEQEHLDLLRNTWMETNDLNIAVQLCLLRSIFRTKGHLLLPILKYRDRRMSMVNYVFDHITLCEPSCPDLLSEIKGSVLPVRRSS